MEPEQAAEESAESRETRGVYVKFLCDCVKYCGKADLFGEEAGAHTPSDGSLLQLEIYGLLEALLR